MNQDQQSSTLVAGSGKMPVLFLGHGSPMNAIEENEFVEGWRAIGRSIPRPAAILCVSAHWETRGTQVTAMEKPRTIHDFGGFPRELFQVQYPAPGDPELAEETRQVIRQTDVALEQRWGLDHGCWSVVKHLYPDADVPVVQMSLDYNRSPRDHFKLARELASLRDKGILIVGSGNVVHNLHLAAWDRLEEVYGYDWALEAGDRIRERILNGNFDQLVDYSALGREVELAVPTPEHYLPLLYMLALKEDDDRLTLFNDQFVAGSLSMMCVKIDRR